MVINTGTSGFNLSNTMGVTRDYSVLHGAFLILPEEKVPKLELMNCPYGYSEVVK